MPNADLSKHTECAPWRFEDRSFCESATEKRWRTRRRGSAFACDKPRWPAESKLGEGERRMVDLTGTSWNQLAIWLRQLSQIRVLA